MLAIEKKKRFDDESEIAFRVFWGYCGRTRRNQLRRQRWRRSCAWPIKRCHQVQTRHGFEQCPEVSAEARMLCDRHSGYIRQFSNGLLISVEAASVGGLFRVRRRAPQTRPCADADRPAHDSVAAAGLTDGALWPEKRGRLRWASVPRLDTGLFPSAGTGLI